MPLDPKNLTAQIAHRSVGNPPSTVPSAAVSNFFPGLEFDFRNVWRRIFVGLELHEGAFLVIQVEAGGPAAAQGVQPGHTLMQVNGHPVAADRINNAGAKVGTASLEWSNSLADVLHSGGLVTCLFQTQAGATLSAQLSIRSLFEGAAVSRDLATPGELTQSLCSPWQADYRECGCFYWSASRPDFVNVENPGTGAVGHSWMQRDRTAATPKTYIPDDFANLDPQLVNYEDLYRAWERHLRFIIGGKDEP
jgi:hypothetical protein